MPRTPDVSRIRLHGAWSTDILEVPSLKHWLKSDLRESMDGCRISVLLNTGWAQFLTSSSSPKTVFHTSRTVSVFIFIPCDEAFLGLSQVQFLVLIALLSQQSHLDKQGNWAHLSFCLILLWGVREEWKLVEWPLYLFPNKFLFSHVSMVEMSSCSG